ncbi:MAG: VOC family protein [Paracoccaceae bacterium]
MSRMIFVNLPITDLARAKAFYEGVGFSINPDFSDDTGACVVISDTIYLMILTRDKFASFASLPTGEPSRQVSVMTALSCADRAEVDAMTERALKSGGAEPMPPQDHGFMYGRTFTDPDGNWFEPFFMDMSAAPGA